MQSYYCVVQLVVGLLIKPRLGKGKVYVFEGLRNSEYMHLFDPGSVVIVGSHYEKQYAKIKGYKFVWGFPIESAVKVKISRGWRWPGAKILKRWHDAVELSEKVIFFLYEDTQPLGVFFAAVAKNKTGKAVSVCIQHGYHMKRSFPAAYDGELSDVNFLWDIRQADVIGCQSSNCIEIGLPYTANATHANALSVVLVGTGTKDDGSEMFQKCMNVYAVIKKALIPDGIKVCYRPHPIEYVDEPFMRWLRTEYDVIEDPDKVSLLNSSQAIFVGAESSLLYEAGLAGHIVAFFKASKSIPQFSYDFKFATESVDGFIDWVKNIHTNGYAYYRRGPVACKDPMTRFLFGLKKAGLM